MILLDTHVLIWLLEGSLQLGSGAQKLIESGTQQSEITVSAITFWEIAMLQQKGRLELQLPLAAWRRRALELGIQEAPVDGEIGIAAAEINSLHADPADRIIVATGLLNAGTLVTADRRILDWSGSLIRRDARV